MKNLNFYEGNYFSVNEWKSVACWWRTAIRISWRGEKVHGMCVWNEIWCTWWCRYNPSVSNIKCWLMHEMAIARLKTNILNLNSASSTHTLMIQYYVSVVQRRGALLCKKRISGGEVCVCAFLDSFFRTASYIYQLRASTRAFHSVVSGAVLKSDSK